MRLAALDPHSGPAPSGPERIQHAEIQPTLVPPAAALPGQRSPLRLPRRRRPRRRVPVLGAVHDRRSRAAGHRGTAHLLPLPRRHLGGRRCVRRVRVGRGRACRPLGPSQPGGVRMPAHGCDHRVLDDPPRQQGRAGGGVRGAERGRGRRARRDARTHPRLLTPGRPRHRDGVLDARSAARLHRRRHSGHPHARHAFVAESVLHRRHRIHPRRVRRYRLPPRAVPSTARPAHGRTEGPVRSSRRRPPRSTRSNCWSITGGGCSSSMYWAVQSA